MPLVVKHGKVIDTGVLIGSEGWRKFLEGNSSFRYETESYGGYTATKQNDYWYASRKYQGKLYRKYVGTTSELSTPQLDAAAIALTEMIEQSPVKEKPNVQRVESNDQQLYKQVEYLTEEVERLKAEVVDLRGRGSNTYQNQPALLQRVPDYEADQQNTGLADSGGDNASKVDSLSERKDYEAAKQRVLSRWRLIKRGESKERIAQALDQLIEELR